MNEQEIRDRLVLASHRSHQVHREDSNDNKQDPSVSDFNSHFILLSLGEACSISIVRLFFTCQLDIQSFLNEI